MKGKQTWILLADGSHAKTFLNDGVGKGLKSVAAGTFEHSDLPTREINSDKPGVSFASAGEGRHRMQPTTDPNRQAKLAFAKQLAVFLEQSLDKKKFDRLVLVAPPRMLGDLRLAMPAKVRTLVYRELDKDLMQIPEQELRIHLDELLAL
jgi:protein required for attachment to host cells